MSLDGFHYLGLDPNYIGSCPCAAFKVEGTKFDAHCWRVCATCAHAGLHYEGDPEVASRVFAAMAEMEWGEWQLVEGLRW